MNYSSKSEEESWGWASCFLSVSAIDDCFQIEYNKVWVSIDKYNSIENEHSEENNVEYERCGSPSGNNNSIIKTGMELDAIFDVIRCLLFSDGGTK